MITYYISEIYANIILIVNSIYSNNKFGCFGNDFQTTPRYTSHWRYCGGWPERRTIKTVEICVPPVYATLALIEPVNQNQIWNSPCQPNTKKYLFIEYRSKSSDINVSYHEVHQLYRLSFFFIFLLRTAILANLSFMVVSQSFGNLFEPNFCFEYVKTLSATREFLVLFTFIFILVLAERKHIFRWREQKMF